MLTARALGSIAVGRGNRLMQIYRDGLLRHWGLRDRLVARALGLAGVGRWTRFELDFLSPEVRARALGTFDRRGVHRLLNPGAMPLARNILRDKRNFGRLMRDHGLPVAEEFGEESGPLADWLAREDAVILKPSFSSKGKGIERFSRTGLRRWTGAQEIEEDALIARTETLLREGGLVQRALATHETLQPVSPGALPTLRLITCLDEQGAAELGSAALRLSRDGTNPVDNFAAGNMVCAVDADRKCATAFLPEGHRMLRPSTHPVTGAEITGRPVPHFDEAVELVLQGHRLLADKFRLIGWDVGITQQGPVIIEGNWNPGTRISQLIEGRGLDETRLGALYRHHLSALDAKSWRTARPLQLDNRG